MGKSKKVVGVLHNDNCTVSLYKKPSLKEIKKQKEQISKGLRKPEIVDYDETKTIIEENGEVHNVIVKASEKKFGIFNKKGYRPIVMFYTREEAEQTLKSWKRPDLYDIRELLWFDEDKEIK